MPNEGYITLSYKILKWGWYSDANTARVFIHLLLNANWHDSEYHGYPILRGQCVFGRKQFSEDLLISEQSIRTAINHLKSTNEITIKVTNKFSVITIVNYSVYQICRDEINQQNNQQSNIQLTNNQPTTNHIPNVQTITNSKTNNIKGLISGFSPEFQTAFMEFSEMRTKIKHALTLKAAEMALAELNKIAKTDEEKIEILNQSVFHSWQGLFELKDKPQSKGWGYEV